MQYESNLKNLKMNCQQLSEKFLKFGRHVPLIGIYQKYTAIFKIKPHPICLATKWTLVELIRPKVSVKSNSPRSCH